MMRPVAYEVEALSFEIDGDNELKAYMNIAQRIGFVPVDLLRHQLLSFFKEQNIKLFDPKKVHLYLTAKALEATPHEEAVKRLMYKNWTRWCWRPLRSQDKGYEWEIEITRDDEEWRIYDAMARNGDELNDQGLYDPEQRSCRVYDGNIPLRVISRVCEIEEQFKGLVRFFVSDYTDEKPDPFIALKMSHSRSFDDLLIFDAWDEPGFTG